MVAQQGTAAASNVVATVACAIPRSLIYLATVPIGDVPAGATRTDAEGRRDLAPGIDDGIFLDLASPSPPRAA